MEWQNRSLAELSTWQVRNGHSDFALRRLVFVQCRNSGRYYALDDGRNQLTRFIETGPIADRGEIKAQLAARLGGGIGILAQLGHSDCVPATMRAQCRSKVAFGARDFSQGFQR